MPEASILMFAALLVVVLDGVLFFLNESIFKDLKKYHELLSEYSKNCDKTNDECIEKANLCVDVANKCLDKCNECVDYTNEMVRVWELCSQIYYLPGM